MKFCTIDYLIQITSFLLSVELICAGCKGFGGKCCAGYIWNEKKEECAKCPPGYIGISCQVPCHYPSFGDRCQQECFCEMEYCNVATGCQNHTTDTPGGHNGSFFEMLDFTDIVTRANINKTLTTRTDSTYDLDQIALTISLSSVMVLVSFMVLLIYKHRKWRKYDASKTKVTDEDKYQTIHHTDTDSNNYDAIQNIAKHEALGHIVILHNKELDTYTIEIKSEPIKLNVFQQNKLGKNKGDRADQSTEQVGVNAYSTCEETESLRHVASNDGYVYMKPKGKRNKRHSI